MKRYAGEGYVHVDPVIRRIRQTTMPFGWHEAPYDPEDGGAVKVMNEATEFGLADGLAVPIYTTHGFQAIVTFGADQMVLSRDGRAGLHLIAIYAHGQARSILARQQGSPGKRTRSCIRARSNVSSGRLPARPLGRFRSSSASLTGPSTSTSPPLPRSSAPSIGYRLSPRL
jgi:hypothetical protein